MIFNASIINEQGIPGIWESTLANRPNPSQEGRLFVRTDSPFGIYRDTGSSWVNISGGGGGSQNWDNVLSQGGVFTDNHDVYFNSYNLNFYDVNNFIIQGSGSNKYLTFTGGQIFYYDSGILDVNWLFVTTTGVVKLGDFYYSNHGTSFLIDDSNYLIRTKGLNGYTGLVLDFYSNNFILGDYFDALNGCKLIVDDQNNSIRTTGGGYTNIGAFGFRVDLTGQIVLGDYQGSQNYSLLDISDFNNYIKTSFFNKNFGLYFWCDDTTASYIKLGDINSNYGVPLITMSNGYFELNYFNNPYGIKLDWINGIYYFGNWGSNIYSLALIYTNNTIYTSNFYNAFGTYVNYTNRETFLGDFNNSLGLANLKLAYTNFSLNNITRMDFNGTNITTTSGGVTVSQHLIVYINGAQYKIQLRQ